MSPFSLRRLMPNLKLHSDWEEKNAVDSGATVAEAAPRPLGTPHLDVPGLNASAMPSVGGHCETFMEDYRRPPPLPQIPLAKDVEIVAQLNPHGATPMFIIRAGENVLLLKVYANRKPINHNDDFHAPGPVADPRTLFEHESEAYAHLLYHGVCDRGAVPRCYGWVELDSRHLQAIFALPDISDNAWDLKIGDNPPRGIVLEYFPDAEVMTIENINHDLAREALRGLHLIHSAYVLHHAITRRHITILPGERIVWVDFSQSKTAADKSLTQKDFDDELGEAWDYMYWQMLPEKRLIRARRIASRQSML